MPLKTRQQQYVVFFYKAFQNEVLFFQSTGLQLIIKTTKIYLKKNRMNYRNEQIFDGVCWVKITQWSTSIN